MKRTPLKRKTSLSSRPKTTPKKLKARADRLFSAIVRSRGHCERCGTTQTLQCAHVRSRRYTRTRWDTDNAFCLCGTCHYFFTLNPLRWEQWCIEQRGQSWWDELRERALDPAGSLRMTTLREIVIALEVELARIDPTSSVLRS